MTGRTFMIIRSKTWIGFQCPVCGEIQKQELSAFSFSGGEQHGILCKNCHQPIAVITVSEGKKYQIQTRCPECYVPHTFRIGRGEFWLSPCREFECPETGETIFAAGDSEKIERLLEERVYLDEEELDPDWDDMPDEFELPWEEMSEDMSVEELQEVIAAAQTLKTIEHFKQLGEQGKISCICGNPRIQLKLEDSRIEFVCLHCGRREYLSIADREDVLLAMQRKSVLLSGQPELKK